MKILSNGADLNKLTTSGIYKINSIQTCLNIPQGPEDSVIINAMEISTGSVYFQELFNYRGIFYRNYSFDQWHSWVKLSAN